METVHGQTLHNGSLQLDDKTFIDCIFVNCVLEYSGRPVHFERTLLTGCHYVFSGQAKCTIEFLQCTGLMQQDAKWGELQPVVN